MLSKLKSQSTTAFKASASLMLLSHFLKQHDSTDKQNECGGILAYVGGEPGKGMGSLSFQQKFASILQR